MRRLVALLLVLICGIGAPAGALALGTATTPAISTSHGYDANTSESAFAIAIAGDAARDPMSKPATESTRRVAALGRVFVAAESVDEIPGLSSSYKDVTTGNSIRNVATDVTPQQFGDNLTAEGWKVTTSTSGRGATMYTRDGAKYAVYPESGSTGGPTAAFTPRGGSGATLKIRLGP